MLPYHTWRCAHCRAINEPAAVCRICKEKKA